LIVSPGHCEKHAKDKVGWYATSTESSADRGYGWEWQKQRKRIFERDHGVCQPCKRQGHPKEAAEVDHIVSKAVAKARGWTPAHIDADANLQSICVECHKAKTKAERHSYGQ
jgi:5-methylcytosine-specific restriction protein A